MLQGYKSQSGQTLYDIVNATYGSMDFVYKFIFDNPNVNSFDFNTSGVFLYDASLVAAPKKNIVTVKKSTIPVITAEDGQSIYDLAIMAFGDVTKAVNFISNNTINSMNDAEFQGKKISFTNSVIQQTIGVINSHIYKKGRAFSNAFSLAFG